MGELVFLNNITKLDIPAERVLSEASSSSLDKAVVMGYDQDGELYFASSMADGGDVLWLMEECKQRLLKGA